MHEKIKTTEHIVYTVQIETRLSNRYDDTYLIRRWFINLDISVHNLNINFDKPFNYCINNS